MLIGEHLVASTLGRVRSLLRPEHARWLWHRLRANLPSALACVLMPDHLHVFVPPGLRSVLVHVLAAFTTRFGVRFELLDPQPAHSAEIAHRMIRYVLLNPVRERLVDDPWRWRWSTLRDLVGAAHPIWTPAQTLATTLELPADRLLRALTWTADARPLVPQPVAVTIAALAGIRAAVCAALRIEDAAVNEHALPRTLVVQAAHAMTKIDPDVLAADLACSRRTIFRDRAAPRHAALDAVRLCLADARLHGTPSASPSRSEPQTPVGWHSE
jgi:hypothetical protein